MTDIDDKEIDLADLLSDKSELETIMAKYPFLTKDKIGSLSKKELEVLLALSELGGDASIREISSIIASKGLKEDTIRKQLKNLIQNDIVEITGHSSRNTRYVIKGILEK